MRYLSIILLFISSVALAQNTTTKNIYSKMQTVADTSVSLPVGYGGLRFNDKASPHKWQFNNGSGWLDLGSGGGGVSSCKPAGHEYTSSHTLVIGDVNLCNNMGVVRLNATSAINLTVPLNSSVAFEQWTQIGLDNQGTDTVTVVYTGGVVGTSFEIPPHSFALIIKSATNTWDGGGGGGSGSSFTLADGNGTTANGSAVDLGGTQNADVIIDGNDHSFLWSTTGASLGAFSIESTDLFGTDSYFQISAGQMLFTNTLTVSGSDYESVIQFNPSGIVHEYDRSVTGSGVRATNAIITQDDIGIAFKTGASSGIDRFIVKANGGLALEHTNTTAGTTGNRTINQMSGTVNFAAASSTLTVTNSLCTTTSIVFAVVRTNDTTAILKNVVPGSGSFVITLSAAATAETSVGFWIIN